MQEHPRDFRDPLPFWLRETLALIGVLVVGFLLIVAMPLILSGLQ